MAAFQYHAKRPWRTRSPFRYVHAVIFPAALLLGGTLACRDLSGLAGTQQLPSGTPDPKTYHTAAGALALYQATIAAFQNSAIGLALPSGTGTSQTQTSAGAFVDFVLTSGLLTDELQAGDLGCIGFSCGANYRDKIDARMLVEGDENEPLRQVYQELHAIRNGATEGIGALAAYDSSASPALRGHLYALAGYAELFLADLYCSGIPLSTITFNGDFTYTAGSTTAQVYHDAIAKFDTAITLSSDSAHILNLARVGKGRAYLALALYDSAATAVASVPDGFTYQFLVNWAGYADVGGRMFSCRGSGACSTVADQEGLNGLPYRTMGDPRTVAQVVGTGPYGLPKYAPLKYGGASPAILPITVADWIEARLIQAEAALHGVATGQESWLDQLNALRATAPIPGTTQPDPAALPPLSDPGASPGDTARVNLVFRERAYWLFLTGHRQGDLRRLIRQYNELPDHVYPTGPYPLLQLGTYGGSVNAPIPVGTSGEGPNPRFHGCFSRSA